MIELSPGIIMAIMFGGLLLLVLFGYPLAFAIGLTAIVVGFITLGAPVFNIFYRQIFGILRSYILLAIPLFIFMGAVLSRSGLVDRMYGAFYVFLSGFRGGLAIITVLVGTVLAACTGVMSGSVAMLTITAIPSMIKRGYNKSLAAGAVSAGGCLGTLIPPSIMLVIYGAMAGVSVGKLFMAAFIPGFILSGLYCSYIALRCLFQPQLAPPVPPEERAIPFIKKTSMVVTTVIPTAVIIMAVLGSIFMGIAPPTEAAAVGCLAVTLLTAAYRKLNWRVMRDAALETLTLTSRAMLISGTSVGFVGVFIILGCGDVLEALILAAPGGRWGAFAAVMLIYFILGFFIDWIGIFFIMVPLLAPLAPLLGFDPLWFGMMICINLQMSYQTPPFAPGIYYVLGSSAPEWGMTTPVVIRGCFPYVGLITIGLVLFIAFPQIILWLPSMMIKPFG